MMEVEDIFGGYLMGKPDLGKHLKNARTKRGMTQKDLASKLGLTESAISAWENGVRSPNYRDMMRVCAFFGISVEELLHGRNSSTNQEAGTYEPWTFGVEYTMLRDSSVGIQRETLLAHFLLAVLALSTGWTVLAYMTAAVGVYRIMMAFYRLLTIHDKKVMINYGLRQKALLVYDGSVEELDKTNDAQAFLMFFGMLALSFGVLVFSFHIDTFTDTMLSKWLLIALGLVILAGEVGASTRFFDRIGYDRYDLSEVQDPMSMRVHDWLVVLAAILLSVYLGVLVFNPPGYFWSPHLGITIFLGVYDFFRIEFNKVTSDHNLRYALEIVTVSESEESHKT
jgi:transcriptional regulator with XRE-family HTH domain